jgi:hypothetical protein
MFALRIKIIILFNYFVLLLDALLFAFEHVLMNFEQAIACSNISKRGHRNIQGISKNVKDEQGEEGTKGGRGCETFPMVGHLYSR